MKGSRISNPGISRPTGLNLLLDGPFGKCIKRDISINRVPFVQRSSNISWMGACLSFLKSFNVNYRLYMVLKVFTFRLSSTHPGLIESLFNNRDSNQKWGARARMMTLLLASRTLNKNLANSSKLVLTLSATSAATSYSEKENNGKKPLSK